jgi:hypothetical protein
MKKQVRRRSIVLLVLSAAMWTSTLQAFFCFSMGGGNRHRDGYYPVPLPYGEFGAGGYPALPYSYSPVMPEQIIPPAETRNVELPIPVAPVPKQHIFH